MSRPRRWFKRRRWGESGDQGIAMLAIFLLMMALVGWFQ